MKQNMIKFHLKISIYRNNVLADNQQINSGIKRLNISGNLVIIIDEKDIIFSRDIFRRLRDVSI